MKKLLLSLAIIVGIAGLIFAANDVLIVGNSSALTGTWKTVYVDTFTTHVDSGEITFKFSRPIYNVNVTSLNGAGDSGYVNVWTEGPIQTFGGNAHTDAVAEGYLTHAVGDNTEADTIKFHMGIRELHIQAVKGGTADSACLVHLWGVQE